MNKPLRTVIGSLAVLASLVTGPAHAHSIGIFQLIQNVLLGELFLITLVADYTVSPLQSADPGFRASAEVPEIVVDEVGISVSWDPAVIDAIWIDTLNPPWDNSLIRRDTGIATLFLKSSAGTDNPVFSVANTGFVARGTGTTDVIIDTTSGDCTTIRCGVFSDGVELPTEFINGSVVVKDPAAVPLPAGYWLFASGLLAMASVTAKRKIQESTPYACSAA